VLTCDCDGREYPALPVLDRLFAVPLHVLLQDLDRAAPVPGRRPVRVWLFPSTGEDPAVPHAVNEGRDGAADLLMFEVDFVIVFVEI
jgi:hypothetical protein